MYLKELTLRGFKSFASATTLRFEPGITAVVGPNGSGKSNIVDALTWVMGEQGAKSLRGASMEDVIFAGTSSRPPLGRAQVSLTIDNTDHALDIDYTEVTIARTIFRNGGSEYAINGSTCRLLDIQELLSDTGLGQQMHVIVGQGRLDAILKADPSGHRAFIEEAAGIVKHRKRKERALRKLANTETNLSRLDDLLGEIHRRLGPLGRQARVSRRADRIQVTLRDAMARLYADDAQRIDGQRRTLREELTGVRGKLNGAQRDMARVKLRIEQVETLSSASSPAIARLNQTWHELSRVEERLRALASLAGERSRSMRSQIVAPGGDDPDLLVARADELDGQAAERQRQTADARLAYDRAVEQRADGERRLASVRQTLTELRRVTQQREAKIAGLRELVAREEAAVQLAQTRGRDLAAQREGLSGQHDEALAQQGALSRAAREAGDDDGSAALEEARRALADRQERLDVLQRRQHDVEGTIISLQAKADALADTLDSRNAAGALERDANVTTLGRLADFIRVADGWEDAVAHALDAFAGATVVPGHDGVRLALDRAREDRLGRAVLLAPLGGRHPAAGAGVDDEPTGQAGIEQAVIEQTDAGRTDGSAGPRAAALLVEANPQSPADAALTDGIVRAVRLLLADVAVADTLDEAMTIVGAASGRYAGDRCVTRAVTRAGEIITPVGGAGGSSLAHSDLSLAARRDKALRQVEQLRGQVEQLHDEVAAATQARDRARLDVDRAATARTEARLKARHAADALKAAGERIAGLERQLHALDERRAKAGDDERTHRLKLDDLHRALDAAQSSTGTHADSDELTTREQDLETMLVGAREQEVAAKIAWSDVSRKAESLQRQAGLLRDQAKEAVARRERLQALNARRSEQAQRAARVADDALAVAELAARTIADVAARRDALQRDASGHDAELKALRAERNTLEPKVSDLIAREHTLDVNRERLAAEYGQITQKIADDLGLGVEELIRDYGPERPVPVLGDDGRPVPLDPDAPAGDTGEAPADLDPARWQTTPYVRAEQRKRLEQAKRDLAALGKVNPLAGEEYEALQTRNRYLNDQRDDVVKSRDDLMQLIRDLDATMVDVFLAAFEDTAAAFEQVFATLFPGGTGRLRLADPDDPLGTGVIVEASPAGKRVKQLSLLSGGERSLTALAMLLAIFTARPSPFYVMDEVEAALDDVNLTRLLDAFGQLREHAQLIVITHQQRTMSIADALYGVTMRADGVSAVVSQRLRS